jgi:hypothetical protein
VDRTRRGTRALTDGSFSCVGVLVHDGGSQQATSCLDRAVVVVVMLMEGLLRGV